MKDILEDYKEEIKKMLNNKFYVFSIILVTILAYGYFITHVTLGIDDTCLDRYYGDFYSENMIAYREMGKLFIV